MKKIIKVAKIINCFLLLYLFINTTDLLKTKTVVNNSLTYLASSQEKQKFIELIGNAAIQDMKETGVFASVTIGQAVVESSWGTSKIATTYGNYFGMKAGSTIYVNGQPTTCNASNTGIIGNSKSSNEFWSGMAVCLKASEGTYSWFRVYDGILNSIKDHSRNLWCMSDGRYIKNGVFASEDPQTQLYTIAKSGYAVDASGNITIIAGSRYDQYIYNQIIVPNSFTSYDEGYQSTKPSYANSCSTAEYTGTTPTIPNDSYNISYDTSYSGELDKGYIYNTQYNKALKTTDADKIEANIMNIISNIFEKASVYPNGKTGADAYIADVEYYSGTFRNPIIYFNQGDYANYRYGNYGTIKSHGCGPTSMAIVVSSFKQTPISPVVMTDFACSNGYCTSSGSMHSLICATANKYGLNCSSAIDSTSDLQPVVNALSSGNSLVVVLARSGYFTKGGHFFVLTGIDENGQVTIADPGSRNKTKEKFYLNFLINPTQGHVVKFWIISG